MESEDKGQMQRTGRGHQLRSYHSNTGKGSSRPGLYPLKWTGGDGEEGGL